jgi:hypothetical protein
MSPFKRCGLLHSILINLLTYFTEETPRTPLPAAGSHPCDPPLAIVGVFRFPLLVSMLCVIRRRSELVSIGRLFARKVALEWTLCILVLFLTCIDHGQ